MTLHSLPIFVRLAGRPVILVGEGEAADAKRRLLERAGANVVGEDSADARLAIVIDDADAIARLKARGVLVNAVDRPELCDFTLPAIVERGDVIVAVGTGGASAGLAAALRQRFEALLAAALRQRFEALLPVSLGDLAARLRAARADLRTLYPDAAERRRAIGAALAPGGAIDPLRSDPDVDAWLALGGGDSDVSTQILLFELPSPDPDDLTLRVARALAQADRVTHGADVPPAILDRARADAVRIVTDAPPTDAPPGLTVDLRIA